MEGIDAETVQLLLMYMYSSDSMSVISSMSLEQLEAAAVLADIWAMGRFLELSDALLHGKSRSRAMSSIATSCSFDLNRLHGSHQQHEGATAEGHYPAGRHLGHGMLPGALRCSPAWSMTLPRCGAAVWCTSRESQEMSKARQTGLSCGDHCAGRANLKDCPSEEVLEWLLRASKCRFPR